jgi:hypothetical protein
MLTDCIYFAVKDKKTNLFYDKCTQLFECNKEDASLITFDEVLKLKEQTPEIDYYIHENT